MFHRLTSPSYFGGLPAGYDMLNAGNAAAEGPKVGDPNEGTYFVGFGEDATSSRINRGKKALGENTDHLDNLLHRDLAVTKRTADVLATSSVAFMTLPAGTFLGAPGAVSDARTRAFLFSLRDNNDQAILNTFFLEIGVASVTLTGGDAIGGGFSVNPVRLNFGGVIPAGKTYRVYYGARQNVAVLDVDALLADRAFALIYGHAGTTVRAHAASAIAWFGGPAWADVVTLNPPTTVEAQLDKIITDLKVPAGAGRIGAAATGGFPVELLAGTVKSQVDTLLAVLNAVSFASGVSIATPIDDTPDSLGPGSTVQMGLEILFAAVNRANRLLEGTNPGAVLDQPSLVGEIHIPGALVIGTHSPGTISPGGLYVGMPGIACDGDAFLAGSAFITQGIRHKEKILNDAAFNFSVSGFNDRYYLAGSAASIFRVVGITLSKDIYLGLSPPPSEGAPGTRNGNVVEISCRGVIGGHTVGIYEDASPTPNLLLTVSATVSPYTRWIFSGSAWVLL